MLTQCRWNGHCQGWEFPIWKAEAPFTCPRTEPSSSCTPGLQNSLSCSNNALRWPQVFQGALSVGPAETRCLFPSRFTQWKLRAISYSSQPNWKHQYVVPSVSWVTSIWQHQSHRYVAGTCTISPSPAACALTSDRPCFQHIRDPQVLTSSPGNTALCLHLSFI